MREEGEGGGRGGDTELVRYAECRRQAHAGEAAVHLLGRQREGEFARAARDAVDAVRELGQGGGGITYLWFSSGRGGTHTSVSTLAARTTPSPSQDARAS